MHGWAGWSVFLTAWIWGIVGHSRSGFQISCATTSLIKWMIDSYTCFSSAGFDVDETLKHLEHPRDHFRFTASFQFVLLLYSIFKKR